MQEKKSLDGVGRVLLPALAIVGVVLSAACLAVVGQLIYRGGCTLESIWIAVWAFAAGFTLALIGASISNLLRS